MSATDFAIAFICGTAAGCTASLLIFAIGLQGQRQRAEEREQAHRWRLYTLARILKLAQASPPRVNDLITLAAREIEESTEWPG